MKCIPGKNYEEEYENIRQEIIEEDYSDYDEQAEEFEDLINRIADEEFEGRFGFEPNLVLYKF